MACLVAWLLACSALQAQNGPLRRPPFYFSVPVTSLTTNSALADGASLPSGERIKLVRAREFEEREAGLRVIPMGGGLSRGAVCTRLEQAKLLAGGDVVLTFRPGWADTLAYPHLQMGTSHAGFVYEEDGKVYSVDMPLDAEYNKAGLRTRLDSQHYAEIEGYHVLRPRQFDSAANANLTGWVKVLRSNLDSIKAQGHLRFNSDYLTPRYAAFGTTPQQSVSAFGALLKQPASESRDYTMYCSEFAWHMLTLAKSSAPDQGKLAPAAVRPVFSPQNFAASGNVPGLTEGPLMVLETLSSNVSQTRRANLASSLFKSQNAASLSPGHRKVAEQTSPLMQRVEPYYQRRLTDNGGSVQRNAAEINQQSVPNFSPTSFMVNSVLPLNHPERKFDYLYTVLFITQAQLDQLERSAP